MIQSKIIRDTRWWFFWGLFFALLVLDQGVKWAVRSGLHENAKPGFPWPNVFEITLTFNRGIAFGMFQGGGVFFVPVAILITVGAAWYSKRHPMESNWIHASFAMLAAGAIGNLIDRVFLGRVTDMFWFRLIDFPVFNIADSCITVAAVILAFRWFLELLHHHPQAGERPTTVESENSVEQA